MATVTGQFPSPEVPPGLAVLEAVLERITYANEDTGYTIARVATQRAGPELLTVVGPLLGAQVGESLRLTGRYAQVVPRNSGMWPTVGPRPAANSGKSGNFDQRPGEPRRCPGPGVP